MNTGVQPRADAVDETHSVAFTVQVEHQDDGHWRARVPQNGCAALGVTREAAIRAVVDVVIANELAEDPAYLTLEEAAALRRAEEEDGDEFIGLDQYCDRQGLSFEDIKRQAAEVTS